MKLMAMEENSPTKLQALEFAYDSINYGNGIEETYAYVSKKDGSIVYDDESLSGEPCPIENIEEDDNWVQVPDKIDLDLGQRLVFRFVSTAMPDHHDEVRNIFNRKGAYARYKNYLEHRGKLNEWYRFEEDETRKALLDWCGAHGIPIEG